MRNTQSFRTPASPDDAVALVRAGQGRAAFLGGGTRLAQSDDPGIETLVDLGPLGLDGLEQTDQGMRIGSMVTLERLRRSDFVRSLGTGILGAALDRTRSIAWRNQATLGGHLRSGEKTDMVATALLALDADCLVLMAPGVPPLTVSLGNVADLPLGALVLAVRVPGGAGSRCALEAFQATALAPPLVAVGVAVEVDAHRAIRSARVAVAGLGKTPARAAHVEAALVGSTDATLQVWQSAFDADARPADDWQASAAYRMHLGRTLLARALQRVGDLENER